jgi:glycosyltransferase involved in cell wall biosynthesis
MIQQLDIIVVLPAYRESLTIVQAVNRLIEILSASQLVFQINVVLDGPDPAIVQALASVSDPRVFQFQLPKNLGKGAALRHGAEFGESRYIAFLDADLDIHPEAVITGFSNLESEPLGRIGVAYGCKLHPKSKVSYPFIRRVLSSQYRRLIRILFRMDIEDTQTGIKVFRTQALRGALTKSVENRFLFDIEIFKLLADNGWSATPIPVVLDYQFSSTIGAISVAQMVMQTIKLRIRMFLNTK